MSRSSIPRTLREEVAQRDDEQCRYCGLRQFGNVATFHIDHITPRSRGGATSLQNLALQCPNCSLHKSNRVDAEDPATGERVTLFNPLTDVWRIHFELAANGAVTGRTPTGRATVIALGMNLPNARIARALQITLGLLETE